MQSLVGQELGKHRVLAELGRGSMGVVYKGVQTTLDRDVAIKVLSPNLVGDKELVARFLREAMLAGKLSHPNIVHIYDQGQEGGIFYIVMEYIDGKSLSQLLGNHGRFGPERTLDIAIQVCDALQYAHEAGVIHRDIKPDNIMVDKRGVVKVADFGLARGISSLTLTTPGAFIGSPYYVSPEQLKGDTLDFRSDIYAMGRVMYRMLAGRTPFESDDLLALIYMEINQPVPVLSEFEIDVPPDLEAVILKAQAKKREDRYQTAGGMLVALKTVQARLQAPVAPAPPRRQPPAPGTGVVTPTTVKSPPAASAMSASSDSVLPMPEHAVLASDGQPQQSPPAKGIGFFSRAFSALSYLGLLGVICLLLGQKNKHILLHARQAVVLHVLRLVAISVLLYAFDALRPKDVFLLATLGAPVPDGDHSPIMIAATWSATVACWLIAALGSWRAVKGISWRIPFVGPISEIQVVEQCLGIEDERFEETKEREEREKQEFVELQKERWNRYHETLASTQRERARQQREQEIRARVDEIVKRVEQLNAELAFGRVDLERFEDLQGLYESEFAALKEEARSLGVNLGNKTLNWIGDKRRR